MSNPTTNQKPVVLIGPVCADPAESVSSVNKSFIEGLSDQYRFVAPSADRKYGNTRQARFNFWNVYYLLKHALLWFWSLLRHRPAIAHYGLTTGWALEKGILFLAMARFCGARTIAHLHSGEFISCWEGLSARRRARAARELAKLDVFVVLSEYWRGVVAERVPIAPDKIHVVSNPISSSFEGAALPWPVSRGARCILALGVMGRDKGVLDIVEAAARLKTQWPDFELILAGPERDPGILAEVRQRIQLHALEANIVLMTGVWGEEKLNLFRRSQILLLPSYFENFPLVVLEAAAAGLAIVTTPVGAVPEFFSDEVSALFIAPGVPGQLADSILKLLRNPNFQSFLGGNARKTFVEHLQRRSIMATVREIYADQISGVPSGFTRLTTISGSAWGGAE